MEWRTSGKEGTQGEELNPLAALLTLLVVGGNGQQDKREAKPPRYLVAKGIQTLPMK